MCGEKNDEDGCGREEKEMKTEPGLGWMDSVNVGLREKRMSGPKTHNRARWRQLARNIDPP